MRVEQRGRITPTDLLVKLLLVQSSIGLAFRAAKRTLLPHDELPKEPDKHRMTNSFYVRGMPGVAQHDSLPHSLASAHHVLLILLHPGNLLRRALALAVC